jgi:hypothetical protein
MTKPRVNINPFANNYSAPNERIIEYSSKSGGGSGGLIALRETDDGRLTVYLYRHDATVDIRVGPAEGLPSTSTDPEGTSK